MPSHHLACSRLTGTYSSACRTQVRAVDEKAIAMGLPGVCLMENAALGLTDVVCEELVKLGAGAGSVVGIVTKTGNNGGDGFVLARHLKLRGFVPKVAYCGDRAAANRATDAGINLTVLEAMAKEGTIVDVADGAQLTKVLADWSDAVLLVDCLYGTGLDRMLRPDGVALVEALDASSLPKVACDLPSGLDCDSGKPLGAAVRAVRTATFVGRKRGFDAPEAAAFTGEVTVVPIGCPPEAWAHVE